MTAPEQPARPAEPIDPELVRQKQAAQLADWTARRAAELEVYKADQQALDVVEPQTMRQRIAYARELVESGLVPAGWTGAKPGAVLTDRQVEKAARGIVLATEWGKHLGFEGLSALQNLQVVEGNVGVKPKAARGMIIGRGHDIADETAYNRNGFPVAHTVTITRKGREPKSFTFRIEDAAQAGLVTTIVRDADGEITGVVARSEKGNPLNWEKYPGRMLIWRATSAAVDLYASDIIGGMGLAPDLPEAEPASPVHAQARREAVAETVQQVTGERLDATPEPYDPAADLTLIEEATGQADPPPWWEQADARERLGVRKRSKLQMAGDRVSAWVLANPDESEAIGLKPDGLHRRFGADGAGQWVLDAPEEVVDAEIEDGPITGPPGSFAEPGAERVGEGPEIPPVDLAPDDLDRSAWEADPVHQFDPAPVAPFRDEQIVGPLDGVEDMDLPADDDDPPWDDDADIQPDPAPTVADLLARIDELAATKGQSRNQFMRRWIATKRQDPAAMSAYDLGAFLDSVTT